MANNLGFVPNSLFGSYVFTQSLPSFAQIGLDDGKVSAPAIKFTDDSDTGIWSAANDAISFTTAGTNRMTLNTVSLANTLPFYAADGTAAAPTYSFTSDTNTGIYRVGADSFGISTGGTNRLTLSTSTLTTAVKQIITNAENDVSLTLNQTDATYASAAVFINFTRSASAAFNVFQFITDGATTKAVLNGLGNWLLNDGAAATPCYSFINDSDTGLYSAGANALGIAVGGSQVAQFNTAQALLLAGSASAPSLGFISDSNTGIYNSAADTLDFTTGGTNAISISTTNITSSIRHTVTNTSQTQSGMYVSNTHATYTGNGGLYLNFTRAANSAYNMIYCYANSVNIAKLNGLGNWQTTDGTAALPAYSFISDPNTGIFNSAADTLDFSTGGTSRLQVTNGAFYSTTPFYNSAGSVTVPSIAFTSDPNTGFYSYGADSIGITAGGVWRQIVDSNGIYGSVPFLAANGSAAAPSHSFTNDTDTGIYGNAGNAILLSCGGASRAYANVNGFHMDTGSSFFIQDGAAATPSLRFLNDTDTGFYSVGADQIGFTTGGTLRLTLSTTALTSTLPVVHPLGSASAPSVTFTSDLNNGIYSSAADNVDVATAGTRRFNIDSAGNVAIGASPSFGSGAVVLFLANATTAPTVNPTAGGILYVESGALKYRGSSGTTTTVAVA